MKSLNEKEKETKKQKNMKFLNDSFEKEKHTKKQKDVKYLNNLFTNNSDDNEQQQSFFMSLLSDSDEILQDLIKDDDSNYLIIKNKCMS